MYFTRSLGLLVLLVVGLLLLAPASAEAQFDQDPGDTCLGPDDPFCAGGGGAGGGGGGAPITSCRKCRSVDIYRWGEYLYTRESCVAASTTGDYMDDCYIQPDGRCELFGDRCVIYWA